MNIGLTYKLKTGRQNIADIIGCWYFNLKIPISYRFQKLISTHHYYERPVLPMHRFTTCQWHVK